MHTAELVTRPTGRGTEIVEVRPGHCPNRHPLTGRNVQVFYDIAPDGVRRRGWRCWECRAVIWAA